METEVEDKIRKLEEDLMMEMASGTSTFTACV